MEYKDYYRILNVDKNADEKEIKRAYRKLAREYHPDKNPDDKVSEEKFKEINEAYEVLGNPENRAKYDQLGRNYHRYQQMGGAPGGFDFSQWTATGETWWSISTSQYRMLMTSLEEVGAFPIFSIQFLAVLFVHKAGMLIAPLDARPRQ